MKSTFKIILLIMLLFLFNCKDKNYQTKIIFGKYINNYEENAEHFVELKEDSTFLHYYKDKKNKIKKNIGKWKLITREDKIEILLNSWIDYGYQNKPKCNGCIFFVRLQDGKLIFDEDLDKELNFVNLNY